MLLIGLTYQNWGIVVVSSSLLVSVASGCLKQGRYNYLTMNQGRVTQENKIQWQRLESILGGFFFGFRAMG